MIKRPRNTEPLCVGFPMKRTKISLLFVLFVLFSSKAYAVREKIVHYPMTNGVIECVKKSLPENMRLLQSFFHVDPTSVIYDFPNCCLLVGFNNERYIFSQAAAYIIIAPGNAKVLEPFAQRGVKSDDIILRDDQRSVLLLAPQGDGEDVWTELRHNLKRELASLKNVRVDAQQNVASEEVVQPGLEKASTAVPFATPTPQFTGDIANLVLPEVVFKNARLTDALAMLTTMIDAYSTSPETQLRIHFDEGIDANKPDISLEKQNAKVKDILDLLSKKSGLSYTLKGADVTFHND